MSRPPFACSLALRLFVPLLVVSVLGIAPAPQANDDTLFSMCGRARALVAVTNTARNEHLSGMAVYKDLAQSTVMIPPMPGFAAPTPCKTEVPAQSVVDMRSGGEIPGPPLAALAVVLDYRRAHAWPLGPAHPDRWESEIRLEARGVYDYVAILDLAPNGAASCRGREYYRVDPQSFGVVRYDGCTASHPAVPGLSTISALES
jgi:hypothetical protein